MSSFAKQIVIVFLLMLLGACTRHETVQLTLIIENARAPKGLSESQLAEVQHVSSFIVTVTGPDLEEPFVMNLTADTSSTDLNDIPVGTSRTLKVEALNANGQVVRRNQISDVVIMKENTEPIVISLNTVPFITNLRNGNRVIVTRLQMNGVGEPGGSVEILNDFEGIEEILFDVSVGDFMVSPSVSTGGFAFHPPTLNLGPHTFTVRDIDTGEQSQVSVRLVPAGSLPGIGLVSFGSIDSSNVTSGGIPWSSFDADLAHFPDVMTRRVE